MLKFTDKNALRQILLNNRQNNEIRSSSIDSDGESEPPALMRAISHDDNSQQTPGMFRKNSTVSSVFTLTNVSSVGTMAGGMPNV